MKIEFIIIGVMILFIILFIYIEPIIAKRKVKNNNDHGSARFASTKEIKETFIKEDLNDINESGFPIFFDNKLKSVYMDKETPHYVYLGSTGSGKSVTAVIPSCTFLANARVKRSVFITDPKGEIFGATSKMFKNNGYEVLTIDFRNPELSSKINLLDPIIKEYDKHIYYEKESKKKINKENKTILINKSVTSLAETNRLIKTLSLMVMAEKQEPKDPFWINSAKNLLEGLIGFFLEEYKLKNIKREQITLTSIRKFQNSFMDELNFRKFKKYIDDKEYGSKSKDSLTSIITASENTYKSITAVFGEKMALFDDLNIANVTSCSDFDFEILGLKPVALLVIVPDEDKVYFSLVTMIVGILYKELVKLANGNEDKKLSVGVDWILDEFANCPPLPDIQAIVSVARSRNMRFYFFIQSFSQLNDVYGKDIAQIILDNCGLVYLKTNTQETAEIISKKLGKKTIESNSVSHSMSMTNYNGNTSTNLIGRELLTAEEVMQLHYKTIIFPVKGYPILRDTIIYNKFKCYIKGKLDRTPSLLQDLKKTFYTVEHIKSRSMILKSKSRTNIKDNNIYEYPEKAEEDKKKLEPVINIIRTILKNQDMKIEYKKGNDYGAYLNIKISSKLEEKEKSFIKLRISNKKFHLEIVEQNNNTNINIYLKNIF